MLPLVLPVPMGVTLSSPSPVWQYLHVLTDSFALRFIPFFLPSKDSAVKSTKASLEEGKGTCQLGAEVTEKEKRDINSLLQL